MRQVASLTAESVDRTVGRFSRFGQLGIVTLGADLPAAAQYQAFIRRSMGVVAIDAASYLHRRVGNLGRFRRLADVVMAHQAKGRFPVVHQFVGPTFVAHVAAVQHRLVQVPGQQFPVLAPVRIVAGEAVQPRQIGSQVLAGEFVVIRIVAAHAQFLAFGVEQPDFATDVGSVAVGAILLRRIVAVVALGEGQFEPRDIKLGLDSGDGWLEVLAGLEQGDDVVVSSQFLIDSESNLQEAVKKLLAARADDLSKEEIDHSNHQMPTDEPNTAPMDDSHMEKE